MDDNIDLFFFGQQKLWQIQNWKLKLQVLWRFTVVWVSERERTYKNPNDFHIESSKIALSLLPPPNHKKHGEAIDKVAVKQIFFGRKEKCLKAPNQCWYR